MKLKTAMISLALLATQASVAGSSHEPAKCPSVAALQSVGVKMTHQSTGSPRSLDAYELKNRYDTDEEWTFLIGPFETEDQAEALSQANAAIARLELGGGPEVYNNVWFCLYHGEDGVINAMTWTPPQDAENSLAFKPPFGWK